MIATVNIAAPLERVHGIRDRFATGGSTTDVMQVLVLLAVGLLLLYLAAILWQHHRRRHINNPRRLFGEVLRQLPLSVAQRDLLRRIARELGLDHPAVLVLSPQVFHSYSNRWMSASCSANQVTRERLDELAQALFPRADVPAP